MLKRILAITICFLFLSSVANAWKPGYGYRKKITIQGANLDANVTHFPLLIYIVDGDIDDHCDDDGDRSFDILFTQSDDTTLDVNWEDYSEAGGNATITAWVSDAGWTIESDGSTFIYLYYGNAAAGDPGTDAGVWDANFVGVWHLTGVYDTTPNETVDSSGANHGEAVGGAIPTEVNGRIYKGQSSDGNDMIDLPTLGVLSNATMECWALADSNSGGQYVAFAGKDGSNQLARNAGVHRLHFRSDNDNITWQNPAGHATGVYYHLAWTYDGSDVRFFIDGTLKSGPTAATGDVLNDADPWGLLTRYNTDDRLWDGDVDEARMSNTRRADAWINFTYHNIAEGDNEISFGAEETESEAEAENAMFFGINFGGKDK